MPYLNHIIVHRVNAEKTSAILRTKKPGLIMGFHLLNFVGKISYEGKEGFCLKLIPNQH